MGEFAWVVYLLAVVATAAWAMWADLCRTAPTLEQPEAERIIDSARLVRAMKERK